MWVAQLLALTFLSVSWLTPTPLLFADLLELRSGRNIEGVVEVLEDGRYKVILDVGRSVTLEPSDVIQRVVRPAPLEIFEKRIRDIDRSDRDALEKLAIWSEDHGLTRTVERVYKLILAIDPHHEGARRELGYVLHDNRWWPKKEVEGLGLQLFRGRWLTVEEIARVKEEAAVREFEVLLEDLHSENEYLSRNARVRILEEKKPPPGEVCGAAARQRRTSQSHVRGGCAEQLGGRCRREGSWNPSSVAPGLSMPHSSSRLVRRCGRHTVRFCASFAIRASSAGRLQT